MVVKWFVAGLLCGGSIVVAANVLVGRKRKFVTARDKQQREQNQSVDKIAWAIDSKHEWTRIDRDLQSAVPLSIQFDQDGVGKDYRLKAVDSTNPDLTVQEVALWFCSLLHRRQTVTENGARSLYCIIAEKQNEWGVEGVEFAFDTLYSVSIRTNRPVQLAWTVHFADDAAENKCSGESVVQVLERKALDDDIELQGDATEPTNVDITAGDSHLSEKHSDAQYIDLYVTATDAEQYGPGYGRFVVRILYTMQK